MARGSKNYRQAILAAIDEMKAWDKEVHLDALVMDTGLEEQQVKSSIASMRKAGYPVSVVHTEGRKILSWKFRNQTKWTDRVVTDAKAKGEAFKGTNYFAQTAEADAVRGTEASEVMRATGHNSVREAANAKPVSEEDMERGRRVLQNYNNLPHQVRDKLAAVKDVLPNQERRALDQVLVDILGAAPVQDTDPSFWAVDQFADGSLMLARKDGTHWKATKL